MKNHFYREYDLAPLGYGYPRGNDYRTPFQVDRDRVLYTSAFRRLQNKTQVFLAGEYDLYRTRLTHSLEVAQIGRSICHWLLDQTPELNDTYFIDPILVEAACLAHDLGHPPFGHNGERALHHLMKPYGGFEGNAQTLRILTNIIYFDPEKAAFAGMNPTRAFIDSILKYKTCFQERPDAPNHFVYDSQESILESVFEEHWPGVKALEPGKERNAFKSIECQIMDWADDTAYSLNDLVDGINIGFLNLEKIERWASHTNLSEREDKHIRMLLDLIRKQRVEPGLGHKIGRFIQATHLQTVDHPLSKKTNRYAYRLAIEPEVLEEAALYKKLAYEVVFQSQQLHQLDFKGDKLLGELFQGLAKNYVTDPPKRMCLLPEGQDRLLRSIDDLQVRARMLCDYLATMTDGFATRTYKRLFDADFGSIIDLV